MNSLQLLELIGEAQDADIRKAFGAGRRRIWWAAAACLCVILLCVPATLLRSGFGLRCYLLDTQNGSPAGVTLARAEEADDWTRGSFQSETAAPTVTVTFNGNTYTGSYRYSVCPGGQGITKDYYGPENPEEADYDGFSVISGTGELAYISLLSNALLEEMEQQPRLENAGYALEELAFYWAAQFIDPEEYTFRMVRGGYGAGDVRNYLYEFVCTVDGVDTTDKLTVLLTDRGYLIHIGVGHPGWTQDKQAQLFRLKAANTDRLVKKAMNGLQYRIAEKTYGITPQGQAVLMVNCEVTLPTGAACGVVVLIK